MIGTALLIALWDATVGKLFPRRLGHKLANGERIVIPGFALEGGRDIFPGPSWLVFSMGEPIDVAGDRSGIALRKFDNRPLINVKPRRNGKQLPNRPQFWQLFEGEANGRTVVLGCEEDHAKLVSAVLTSWGNLQANT